MRSSQLKKKSSLKPWAIILETSSEPGLGFRHCSQGQDFVPISPSPCIVLQIPWWSKQIPWSNETRPTLASLSWTQPACLIFFSLRNAKISLPFVSFLRRLYIVSQERIIVLWGPYLILGCGGGDAWKENGLWQIGSIWTIMTFQKLPTTASVRLLFQPKYLAK